MYIVILVGSMFSLFQATLNDIEQQIHKLQRCCDFQKELFKPWSGGNKEHVKELKVEEQLKDFYESECAEVKAMSKLLDKADRTLTLIKQKSQLHSVKEKVSKPKGLTTTVKQGKSSTTIADSIGISQDVRGIEIETSKENLTLGMADSEPLLSKERHLQEENLIKLQNLNGDKQPDSVVVDNFVESTVTDNRNLSNLNNSSGSVGVILQSKLSQILSETTGVPRRKYRPAHTTAPFNTATAAPKLKRPPSIPLSRRTNLASAQSVSRKHGHKTVDRSTGGINNSKQRVLKEELAIDKHGRQSSDVENTKSQCSNAGDNLIDIPGVNLECNRTDNAERIVDSKTDRTSLLPSAELSKCPRASSAQNLFTLEADGRSLPVPPKLKHVCTKNKKLVRATVSAIDEIGHREPSASCVQFLRRYYDSMPRRSRASFKRRADVTTRSYALLAGLLRDLQLDTISATSSVPDVCRARVMLEFLLNTFQALVEESRILLAEYKRHQDDDSCREVTQFPTDPFEATPPKFHIFDDTQGTSRHILYSTEHDVHEYWDLRFRYHMLKLQLQTTRLVWQEYGPLLRDLRGTKSFIPVYRGVYSMLRSDSHSFPIFIKDTSSDSDEENK